MQPRLRQPFRGRRGLAVSGVRIPKSSPTKVADFRRPSLGCVLQNTGQRKKRNQGDYTGLGLKIALGGPQPRFWWRAPGPVASWGKPPGPATTPESTGRLDARAPPVRSADERELTSAIRTGPTPRLCKGPGLRPGGFDSVVGLGLTSLVLGAARSQTRPQQDHQESQRNAVTA